MKDFAGKIAVITGAASGIGRSFAKEAARKGMKLALIDINFDGVKAVAEECNELGSPKAVAIKADVSIHEEVRFSIQRVMQDFGGIDLMFHNAGIWPAIKMDLPINEWQWAVNVNTLGPCYYAMEVLPIFVKQGTPCHFMINSSIAGMSAGNEFSTHYMVSKHGATVLAEGLKSYADNHKLDMGVSVFCPNTVATDIANSYKWKPEQYSKPLDPVYASDEYWGGIAMFNQMIDAGYNPDGVALRLFRAIEDNQMYILSHPETHDMVRARFAAIEADMQKEAEI